MIDHWMLHYKRLCGSEIQEPPQNKVSRLTLWEFFFICFTETTSIEFPLHDVFGVLQSFKKNCVNWKPKMAIGIFIKKDFFSTAAINNQ